jgi:hypothetical protein
LAYVAAGYGLAQRHSRFYDALNDWHHPVTLPPTAPPLLHDATSELRLTRIVILLLLAIIIRTQSSQRARKGILTRRAECTAARTRSREGRSLPWTPARGGSQVRGRFERSAGHFGTGTGTGIGTRSLNCDG